MPNPTQPPQPPLPPLPSLRALRAAQVLAGEGSFTAAAERLGVSRSAVSHLIAHLENQLGARLFERRADGVTPTDRGKILISSIAEPLARVEAAVATFRHDRGEVKLSTVSTLAQYWLIPRLPSFHAARPEVRVTVSTTLAEVDFAANDMDCAIRHGLGRWEGLSVDFLFSEALVALVHRDLLGPADLGALTAEALARLPFVAATTRPSDLATWWQGQGFSGAPPTPVLHVETRAQAVAAALAGSGVALVDPRFVHVATAQGLLVTLPLPTVPLETAYYFVAPHARAGRRNVDLLRHWLLAEAKQGNLTR